VEEVFVVRRVEIHAENVYDRMHKAIARHLRGVFVGGM
jgi:hypothetical protein